MSFLEGYLQGRGMQQRQRALEHQEDQDRLDTDLRRDTLRQAQEELAARKATDAANWGLAMWQTMMGLPLQAAQIRHYDAQGKYLGAQGKALDDENKLAADRLKQDQRTVRQAARRSRQADFVGLMGQGETYGTASALSGARLSPAMERALVQASIKEGRLKATRPMTPAEGTGYRAATGAAAQGAMAGLGLAVPGMGALLAPVVQGAMGKSPLPDVKKSPKELRREMRGLTSPTYQREAERRQKMLSFPYLYPWER